MKDYKCNIYYIVMDLLLMNNDYVLVKSKWFLTFKKSVAKLISHGQSFIKTQSYN